MPDYRRIYELPHVDRPREKLVRKGAAALSDFELLEVLIGNGSGKTDVGRIARRVQRLLLKGTEEFTLEELTAIEGIGDAHAGKLLAALELARRHLVENVRPLKRTNDILARLDDLRRQRQEYLVCLSLDGGQRLLAQRTISIGTLDITIAHPREVFADAIADRAASVIIAHNHPSGNPKPSLNDTSITQQLTAAGELVGIPVRDHIIVTATTHFSFREHHLL